MNSSSGCDTLKTSMLFFNGMDHMDQKRNVVNFLFEAGHLFRTPRAGFQFLGSGKQSVAEHLFRTAIIGYSLAKLDGTVDAEKVATMCLFHDFAESRVSDLGYVHQKYVTKDEDKAMEDMATPLPFGKDILDIFHEYEKRESRESVLVKEADNLELLLTLKELSDQGNPQAKDWMPSTVGRLKTDLGREMAEEVMQTESCEWWFGNKNDEYWITRNKS